jgi:hypothetical protein
MNDHVYSANFCIQIALQLTHTRMQFFQKSPLIIPSAHKEMPAKKMLTQVFLVFR